MSWEQINNSIRFIAFYTNDGIGKTGLTVTSDVWNPAGSQVASVASATEIGGGFYRYDLDSGSVGSVGEYISVFKTDGTVDQKHIPALWIVGRAGVENLDATISSRATTSGVVSNGPINTSAGTITVGTNNDKTGYSLNQSFPSNFSSLDITSDGNVSASVITSGITRDSYASLAELSSVPSAPYNPADMNLWMFERSFHKGVTTSGVDVIYKSNGVSSLGTSTLSDDGTSFVRNKYE